MNNLPMAIYLDGDLGSLDPRISWRRCWGQTWTTGRNRARCPGPIHGRGPPVARAAVGRRWAARAMSHESRFTGIGAVGVSFPPVWRLGRVCPPFVHGDGPPSKKARWAKGGQPRSRRPTGGEDPTTPVAGHRMPEWAPAVWIPAAACRALAFSGPVGAPVAAPASRWGTYTWKVTPCGTGIRSLQAALCAFLRRYARSIREWTDSGGCMPRIGVLGSSRRPRRGPGQPLGHVHLEGDALRNGHSFPSSRVVCISSPVRSVYPGIGAGSEHGGHKEILLL